MKNLFLLVSSLLLITSCVKEDIKPQQPLSPQPIVTGNPIGDTNINMKNTTWVITKVLNTSFNQEFRSDTLVFLTNNTYTFNGSLSFYHLYQNNLGFTLTLNDTPWGYLSGTVYDYNLTQGLIENCQFKDYFTNQNSVKIWMIRQ